MIKKTAFLFTLLFFSSCLCCERFIQAGVFLDKKDAINLQTYLVSREYPASLVFQNSYWKIFLGPYDNQNNAEFTVKKLDAEDNIKANAADYASDEQLNTAKSEVDVSDEMLGNLIDAAFEFLGVPYKWGGMDPKKGIDCSFFVQTIYKSFGTVLPRTSNLQFRVGKKVGRNDLIPGDLVFFRKYPKGSRINHVGIYIGKDQFIHAALGAGKVTVSSLNETYFKKRFSGARRQL